MKDDLARTVLVKLLEWNDDALVRDGLDLQALAHFKYDEYEGYGPAEGFLENLARWLSQFRTLAERRLAARFVLDEMVFISRAELEHAIQLVYPDVIRPLIRETAARDLSTQGTPISRYAISTLVARPEFKALRRRVLVLGLADGSRLDQLRRSCQELSVDQFSLVVDLTKASAAVFKDKLVRAQEKLGHPGPATFRNVVLVDDFYGSGYTLLRKKAGKWDGRLIKARESLKNLQKWRVLAADVTVTVLLYVASEMAADYIRAELRKARLSWDLKVVQLLPSNRRVTDPALVKLCHDYYDPLLTDPHKGAAPVGFRDCALPLALSHNTPNNSICLLWADTSEHPDPKSTKLRALFPRYERHHADRP